MTDGWVVFTGLLAAAGFVLSVVNFIQAQDGRIVWKVESLGDGTYYRIVNTSRRTVAKVSSVTDPSDGVAGDFLHTNAYPAEVEPQNWLSVTAMQYENGGGLKLDVVWRQRRLTQKAYGPQEFRASVFL